MGGLEFANLAFLAGLTALALPVLIHLLLKQRKKRLRFSTVEFFVKHDEQSSQRRKLRNLLLLSLRLLIFALLVLAFARPLQTNTPAGGDQRRPRQAVLIVDRSASMNAVTAGGTRFLRAKDAARKALSSLGLADRVAILAADANPEVITPFTEPLVALRYLNDLKPGFGSSDLGEALKKSATLLEAEKSGTERIIYVASDLQKAAQESVGTHPLPKEIVVEVLEEPELMAPNVAITDLSLGGDPVRSASVSIANLGDEPLEKGRFTLSVDGQNVDTRPVDLKVGGSTNLEISLPSLAPGWHNLETRLEAKDALGVDNTRWHALWIEEPVRVAVVETRPSTKSFEEAGFFLAAALDPAAGTTNVIRSGFAVEKVLPEALAARLTPQKGRPVPEVLLVPALQQWPAGAGRTIEDFVRAGGGVALFLGEGISANRYATELKETLPAKLGALEVMREPGTGVSLQHWDTNAPLFAVFREADSGDLGIPEFIRHTALTPQVGSAVSSRLAGGAPFTVEKVSGQGKMVLVNTSADATWTDWMKHKTFVPWLHSLGRHLSQRATQSPVRGTNLFLAGSHQDFELGPNFTNTPLVLKRAGAKDVPVKADDAGWLRNVAAVETGLYTLATSDGREVRRFAVNVPPGESELVATSRKAFDESLVRAEDQAQTTLAAGLFGGDNRQKEFWRIILLCVLGLMLVETLWSNRSYA